MGRQIRAFFSDLNRYLLSLKRSYIWLIGLFVFAAIGISSFYPLNSLAKDFSLQPSDFTLYSLFHPLYQNYIMAIILLFASLLISEDVENGAWSILRSIRLSRFPFIAAKFVWMILYSIAGSLLTILVITLYISSSLGHFSFSYLAAGIELVFAYTFIIALTALIGLTISSIFAKRVYSVLAAAAYLVFLNAVSLNLYMTLFVLGPGFQNGFPGYNINISFIDKLVILMAPSNFQGAAASLIGMHTIVPNFQNGSAPANQITIFVPLLFSTPLGYILPYLILAISSIVLMEVALYVKRRLL